MIHQKVTPLMAACRNLNNRFVGCEEFEAVRKATLVLSNFDYIDITPVTLSIAEQALAIICEIAKNPHIQDLREIGRRCEAIYNILILKLDTDKMMFDALESNDPFLLNELNVISNN